VKLRVKEKKLGRELAYGQYWNGEGLIEIDSRLKSKKFLEIACHELLHFCYYKLSENQVDRGAKILARELWKMRYRRVEK
jgi:hypothetical protein